MKKARMYSKFRPLNYAKNDCSKCFWKKNKYVKDIFEHSRLFAQNYKEFNDIAECTYFVSDGVEEKIIEKIYDEKNKRFICCFSHFTSDNNDDEELMWGHYANGSKGIKIDFTVDYEFSCYIKQVEYKSKKYFDTNEKLEKEFKTYDLENIMCRKSTTWKYEQEYRAIFKEDDEKFNSYKINEKGKKKYFFPIKIEKITLGKGFFLDTKSSNSREAQQDFKNHILKIASFIYQVLKDNEEYSSQLPKFYCYQDKYSQELIEIKTDELDNYIEKHKEFIIT